MEIKVLINNELLKEVLAHGNHSVLRTVQNQCLDEVT